MKKQFRSFHGQISFRSGENLFPISAILESKLSNFTLIILEDIYIYIYIFYDGLYETIGKEKGYILYHSSFFSLNL